MAPYIRTCLAASHTKTPTPAPAIVPDTVSIVHTSFPGCQWPTVRHCNNAMGATNTIPPSGLWYRPQNSTFFGGCMLLRSVRRKRSVKITLLFMTIRLLPATRALFCPFNNPGCPVTGVCACVQVISYMVADILTFQPKKVAMLTQLRKHPNHM